MLYPRDNIVSTEEFRTFTLRQDAFNSGIYKMFQHLTGLDQGLDQVKNTTFFRALSPNGCFVLQTASPGQHHMLSEQEVLALQLQEQAARQQVLVHAQQQQLGQQQQPPLQAPQQVQQQVPQEGVDQVKNKRFIRACES